MPPPASAPTVHAAPGTPGKGPGTPGGKRVTWQTPPRSLHQMPFGEGRDQVEDAPANAAPPQRLMSAMEPPAPVSVQAPAPAGREEATQPAVVEPQPAATSKSPPEAAAVGGGRPSGFASQLEAQLAALEAGADLDVIERALAAEDQAAKAAEDAALAALASLG